MPKLSVCRKIEEIENWKFLQNDTAKGSNTSKSEESWFWMNLQRTFNASTLGRWYYQCVWSYLVFRTEHALKVLHRFYISSECKIVILLWSWNTSTDQISKGSFDLVMIKQASNVYDANKKEAKLNLNRNGINKSLTAYLLWSPSTSNYTNTNNRMSSILLWIKLNSLRLSSLAMTFFA